MNSKVQSALRHLLMAAGAFLIGSNVFDKVVDESLLQEAIGVVLTIATFAWAVVEKKSTIEMAQATLRQGATFFGTLLVASGKISDEALQAILGFASVVIPFLYSVLSRQKTRVATDEPESIQKFAR